MSIHAHTHTKAHTYICTHRACGCGSPWGYRRSHQAPQFPPWQHQACSSYGFQSLRPYIALLIMSFPLQGERTESDKRHVALLLPSRLHSLALSCSHGFAWRGRHNRYLIYPSPAQRGGETRLQHCGFPRLILWSSRGWILAPDALVKHWIALHSISLSFHPSHPRLTLLLSPPPPTPKKTPKSSHIATLCFQNQQKKRRSIALLP